MADVFTVSMQGIFNMLVQCWGLMWAIPLCQLFMSVAILVVCIKLYLYLK